MQSLPWKNVQRLLCAELAVEKCTELAVEKCAELAVEKCAEFGSCTRTQFGSREPGQVLLQVFRGPLEYKK